MLLASAEHDVPVGLTLFFGLLLVALIACLSLEEQLQAKKSVIAGSFALASLLLATIANILPFEEVVVGSHVVTTHDGFSGRYVDHQRVTHKVSLAPAADESRGVEQTPEVRPLDMSLDSAAEGEQGTQVAPSPAGDSAGALGQATADGTATVAPQGADISDDSEIHVGGTRISMPVYIPAVDWGVIAIILGSSLFVDITSKSGLFTWIAIVVTKASRGDPRQLLYFYGIMTVGFSAVLNNVTAMIIVGSLTAVSLEKLGRSRQLLGFLMIEGLLTNIGGLLTLISSVPNIIVGTAAHISFAHFFVCAAPYVLVATSATLWLGATFFEVAPLRTAAERAAANALVMSFDENDGIHSHRFFWFGAAMLVAFIVTIATTSLLPYISDLQIGFVALAFAGVMLLRYRSQADEFYRSLDWDLLGFFMALFVVINVMEHALVLDTIGIGLAQLIGLGETVGTAVILLVSAVLSSVTDNIPLAATLAKILTNLEVPDKSPLWWSVVFGANLGGNITPIGSASTLVAVTIMHQHKLPLSFVEFVKKAVPFAIVQLAIAVIYVLLVVPWLP
jgi:Na+/H+ antiporter NhaD/arsenite permease-like protein